MPIKGIFPYEYLDSASRLEETSFKVWTQFSCSTLKTDLKTDVFITDIFENFCKIQNVTGIQ